MREQLIVLGSRLKEIRKARKITLQGLAEQTGLTAGLLSKIENFRTVPSLPVLLAIAAALEADLAELFAGLSVQAQPRWLRVRPGDQREIEREDSEGMQYRVILEAALQATNLQIMLVTIAPGVRRDQVSGEGDEMLYILSGEVEYTLNGGETVTLQAGDTFFFDGAIPHAPANRTGRETTLLVCYFLRETRN